MDTDAFKADVEPGGLYSRTEIKILICYIYKSVNTPIAADTISNIIRSDGLANYFDVSQSMTELVSNGALILSADNEYLLTESGHEIADRLEKTLPFSVREKAMRSALKLTALVRNLKENKVEITETETGTVVTLHILDKTMELMQIRLSVADRMQAEMIRDNFAKDPTDVYKSVLKTLCKEEVE